MLESIAGQVNQYQLHDVVEVVLSNNCSTDGTAAYLAGLSNQYPGIVFRVNNNTENVGFIRNLLKTVEASEAKYWWFIGDDDAISPDVLPQVVDELKQNPGNPVFIFNQKGLNRISRNENISIQLCAEKYYYYMGNAVTICDTALSRKAIKECYNETIATCWPQTCLYFMSMFFSGIEKPVRVSTIEAFKFNVQNNVNASNYYLYVHFWSLFKLGYSIADKNNCAAFVNWFPPGIPFINGSKKYSFIFAITKEYRYFDFDNERKEFDETYKEMQEELLPQHQHYLLLLKLYRFVPGFFIKYYVITRKALYTFIYSLIKKKKLLNPFSVFSEELNAFNSYKEEKWKKKQEKHIRSTMKNEW
jgi:glycosyltransferase involved in cell wall biosynthesis